MKERPPTYNLSDSVDISIATKLTTVLHMLTSVVNIQCRLELCAALGLAVTERISM